MPVAELPPLAETNPPPTNSDAVRDGWQATQAALLTRGDSAQSMDDDNAEPHDDAGDEPRARLPHNGSGQIASMLAGPVTILPAGVDSSGNTVWSIVAVPAAASDATRRIMAGADMNATGGNMGLSHPDSLTAFATHADAPGPAGPLPASPGATPAIKYPTVQINGVLQADAGFFQQSDVNKAQFGTIQDGADFRRVRLSAKGAVSEVTNYFIQMDFGFFGRPTFTDVWMETTDLPVLGNVRIGQWKQPFSLEVVSSFRYTTFMERSSLFQPFTPFRHLGVGFYDHSEDLRNTWAASIFRTGQDQFGGSISTDGGWGSAERITWLPVWDDASNGARYLHLGAGHFYNNPPRDSVNFRSIPEIYIGENAPATVVGTSGQAAPGVFNGTPFFAQTGPLAVSQFNVFGGELLWVHGPLSLQSEAMVACVQKLDGSEAALPGAYAQVGYFLTGEHRPYDRKTGAIDRVIPHENFFRVRTDHGTAMGLGAWEVAARVSWLDLEDQKVRGGTLLDGTFGVNWYLNPYSKLVFNIVHSVPDPSNAGASAMTAYALRAQLDF